MSFFSAIADHLPSLPDVAPTGNQPPKQPPATQTASKATSNENILDSLPTPPDLDNSTRLLLALAVTSASTSSDFFPNYFPPKTEAWIQQTAQEWLKNVKRVIKMDKSGLPATVSAEKVKENAKGHFEGMDEEGKKTEWENVIRTLIIASIFAPPAEGEKVKSVTAPKEVTTSSGGDETKSSGETKEVPTLSYTPIARSLIYRTLNLLSIPTTHLLSIEKELSESLFSTLQKVSEAQNQDELAKAREKQAEGWGGKTGRWLATGAGVIAGGVAIGITGGLAAPAIAALIPGFMTFGLLTTATAPVVLGSIFGVTAGGLTGKRVRERWRGVSEFEFVEVGVGSKKVEEVAPTSPVVKNEDGDDEKFRFSPDRGARASFENEKSPLTGSPSTPSQDRLLLDSPKSPSSLPPYFTEKRSTPSPSNQVRAPEQTSVDETVGRASIESTRSLESRTSKMSLDDPAEREKRAEDEKELLKGKPPSLIATIIVPGLLITSPTEALTTYQNTIIPNSTFSDGRDVYVLKFETKSMLATGKAIHSWVVGKLKGYVKKQVIKRTALSAYFAAVALPMSVYNMTTMYTDNVWIQSQDKAVKAGRLLGEVLEKRVQGQRPVVLIGHSLGALTVFHALQYLASRHDASSLPQIVESAFLISLPSAPTEEEWAKARKVVARRVVNAWCEKDLVLALVVRLHEVVSRAVTLSNGAFVAGLRQVKQPGIEDIDLSEVLDGHLDIQEKMGDILRVIKVDE